jgi:large subunit ribosomal protein L11
MFVKKYIKKVYIQSQEADPSPPLGTILGNIGVNTVNFCSAYNLYTQGLPSYIKLGVVINIHENRTFDFFVTLPPTGYFLSLLRFERTVKVFVNDRYNDQIINCIFLRPLLQLARIKFPQKCMQESLPIILGSVKSMGLVVVRN